MQYYYVRKKLILLNIFGAPANIYVGLLRLDGFGVSVCLRDTPANKSQITITPATSRRSRFS